MTRESEQRPLGAAVAAALAPFMGLPLALALMLVTQGRAEGSFNGLAQAWKEGGFGMYLVLFAASGIGVVCCALAFFGVSRGSSALLAAAPLSTGITTVGAFMFERGMKGAAEVVGHVMPADQATLMARALGEALNASAFGFACSAGLLGAMAMGSVLGVAAQTGMARRTVGVAALVFTLLAAASFASLARINSLIGLFGAIASVAPGERLTLLGAASAESGANVGLLVALALLLVVVALGAVSLKAVPRLALLVPVLGLGGLAGHGAYAFALSRAAALTASITPPRQGYVTFEGRPVDVFPDRCFASTGIVSSEDRSLQAMDALHDELMASLRYQKDLSGGVILPLGVFPGASATSLWTFADVALGAGATGLELIGERDVPEVKFKGEFAVVAPILRRFRTGVTVGLITSVEECASTCVIASVKDGTLVVNGDAWKPGPPVGTPESPQDEVVLVADRTHTPEQVISLALAAAAKGRRLVLALGTPSASAETDDGALSKAQIAAVVTAKSAAIRRCYEHALATEGPGLAGKVTLTWTITDRGTVRFPRVLSSTLPSEAVTKCLIDEVEQLQFPKPRGGVEVEVNYPWVFTSAP
jgi:hypothetical protein